MLEWQGGVSTQRVHVRGYLGIIPVPSRFLLLDVNVPRFHLLGEGKSARMCAPISKTTGRGDPRSMAVPQ
jgi:hypothetical protein